MSRYIDADALMDALNVFKDRKNGNEHFMYGIETAKELLGIQPALDAVPVVRCRDCKYWNRFTRVTLKDGRKGLCEYPGHIMAARDDFFCADGGRRTE